MTGKELAQRAKAATGCKTAAELARRLELEGYESPRRVARWLRGANDPDFASTLKLLALIGLLPEDGELAISPPLEDADSLARLEHLEKQQTQVGQVLSAQTRELRDLAAQTREVLELMGRFVELAEERLPAQDAPVARAT